MVDIAIKALSPGVNDTSTAIASIDEIGAVLVRLSTRRVENPYRTAGGRVRVIATGPTFASLVRTALDEIRWNAGANVRVLRRVLRFLETLVGCTIDPARQAVLLDEAARLLAVGEDTIRDHKDRAEVRADYDRIAAAVNTADA
jgi:uncharacterized membrane protein